MEEWNEKIMDQPWELREWSCQLGDINFCRFVAEAKYTKNVTKVEIKFSSLTHAVVEVNEIVWFGLV